MAPGAGENRKGAVSGFVRYYETDFSGTFKPVLPASSIGMQCLNARLVYAYRPNPFRHHESLGPRVCKARCSQ